MSNPQRKALGDFLRARRHALKPEVVGIQARQRRRTPGLRREEVAELAGIGVDWYIRLEQGRDINPSAATIDALANTLRLNAAEHDHLRALSRAFEGAIYRREEVPETVMRIVDALDQPAYVTSVRWDVLAWNQAADDLFAFSRVREEHRNTMIAVLLNPKVRELFGKGWEDEARRMTAEFRATFDLWSHDISFIALFEQLTAESREFRKWWKTHDIQRVKSGRKSLSHPKKGSIDVEYAAFQLIEDPGFKLVIYAPPKALPE